MVERQWKVKVSDIAATHVQEAGLPPEKRLVVATNYALRPLPEAIINPSVLLPALSGEMKLDVTAFYSRSFPLTEEQLAQRALVDQKASEAAEKIGGLRMYYRGAQIPNVDGLRVDPALGVDWTPDAVSFCIWDSLAQAKDGANLKEHGEAERETSKWYSNFAIRKYNVWTEPGEMHDGRPAQVIVFQEKPFQQNAA